MAYKTFVSIITDATADNDALETARAMALAADGHLEIICLGLDHSQPDFGYAGANALIAQTDINRAITEAEELSVSMREHMRGDDLNWAVTPMALPALGLGSAMAQHLRFADLVVLTRPDPNAPDSQATALIEATLFNAGVPVLVVPSGRPITTPPQDIVIAWNESTEALTAVRAAMPLLLAANSVEIAMIDPPRHGRDRSDPGGALAIMLARHGIVPTVSVLAKTMPSVADTLLRNARENAKSLIVMGAYGHSRIRESLLGGATRDMLLQADLPIFMAR